MTSTPNLASALVVAQSKFKDIKKDVQGHGYKYADLPAVWAAIRPVLTESGLAVAQLLRSEGDRVGVQTILMCAATGESIESTIYAPVDGSNKRTSHIQAVGSTITYLRRYGLSAMLGLTSDEDADGAEPRPAPLTDGDVSTRLSWCETADDCRALWAELRDAGASERQLGMVKAKGESLKGGSK